MASAERLTPRQEIRQLGWIVRRVARLTPAGRDWLRSWLNDPALWPHG